MYGPDVAILLMYGSHDMKHTGFRRLTVVNECDAPNPGGSLTTRQPAEFLCLIS